jgi:hypothetical protein
MVVKGQSHQAPEAAGTVRKTAKRNQDTGKANAPFFSRMQARNAGSVFKEQENRLI